MNNVEEWPNILQVSCGVNTAKFLKYVWPCFRIKHIRVKPEKSNTSFGQIYFNIFSTIQLVLLLFVELLALRSFK